MGPFPHSHCADPSTNLAVPRVQSGMQAFGSHVFDYCFRGKGSEGKIDISVFGGIGTNLGAVKSPCPMTFKNYYLFTRLLVRRPRSSSIFLHIFQPFLLLCPISRVHPNISEPGNTIEAQRKSSSMSG